MTPEPATPEGPALPRPPRPAGSTAAADTAYEIDGRKVDGVTTPDRRRDPQTRADRLGRATTAEYAVDHWDELADLTGTARLRKLERARWDKRRRRRRPRHRRPRRSRCELAGGEEVDVPEPIAGHVDAYLQFVADWQPARAARRRPRCSTAPPVRRDARPRSNASRTETTGYSTGKRARPESSPSPRCSSPPTDTPSSSLTPTAREQPLPPIDFCGCVWLRADGYDLNPVDAGRRNVPDVPVRATGRPAVRSRAPDRFILDTLPVPRQAGDAVSPGDDRGATAPSAASDRRAAAAVGAVRARLPGAQHVERVPVTVIPYTRPPTARRRPARAPPPMGGAARRGRAARARDREHRLRSEGDARERGRDRRRDPVRRRSRTTADASAREDRGDRRETVARRRSATRADPRRRPQRLARGPDQHKGHDRRETVRPGPDPAGHMDDRRRAPREA